MNFKAIVLDIDGTLLNSEGNISSKTKNSLIEFQKKGIKLILASGRPINGMLRFAEALEMKTYEGFLISYNGAMVIECKTGKVLFNQTMPIEISQKILAHLKNFDLIPMINKDSYMYVNNVYHNILHLPSGDFNVIEYESRGGNFKLCEVDDLSTFADFPLNKILVAGQPEYLEEKHQIILEPFKDQVTAAFSAPFYFEFTDKNIDKAKALHAVFPQMDIDATNMIAFGDGGNDQTMVEYVGMGIAMGNAVDDLKRVADYVTLSNDEDGIISALEKCL
ncbi:Cof-type HAD-IIB family hydrolase [Amphibacillus sp. Q70]|uniref:Cof-type HAD-IIB family hydrolase n=1 Tax=Amphibacillus sp. Q70 TaxID=3453416 RepID=UPI003F855B8B